MYINTVGFYTGSLSLAGNPAPYSVTPFLARPFTDSMNLMQRSMNTLWNLAANSVHSLMVRMFLQSVVRKHFGQDTPLVYDLSKNVSFILQNAHATVTYPRAYLPNVAEIACIHCKRAKPLPDVSITYVTKKLPNSTEFLFCLRSTRRTSQIKITAYFYI